MANLLSPEYRNLFYEDAIKNLLKGGSSIDDAIDVYISLYKTYENQTCSREFAEQRVLVEQEYLNEHGKKKSINIHQEVKDLLSFRGSGGVSLNDIYADLNLKSKEERTASRVALNRLISSKIIERVNSGRSGVYRIIDYEKEEMRFIDDDIQEFDVKMPLNLNSLCTLYAKNIIVFGGTKGSGKTTIMLNIALANQYNMPVVYLNSEMGDEEYTQRMKDFGIRNKSDIQFQMFSRSHDFHDLITPERKIFIIDYMEIQDEFWLIGKQIRQVHDKLKNGICFIAIQKKTGAELARGDEFTAEKSRLYVTLEFKPTLKHTIVKIYDAKAPKPPFKEDGVRGLYRNVKIINGVKLSPVTEWLK